MIYARGKCLGSCGHPLGSRDEIQPDPPLEESKPIRRSASSSSCRQPPLEGKSCQMASDELTMEGGENK